MKFNKYHYFLFLFIFFALKVDAQKKTETTSVYVKLAASEEYKKSKLHQFIWGKNRREEWTTPILVPVVLLDTLYGGLTPYQQGGGGETKSLRLRSATGKIYALRSINKFRSKSLPAILNNSFFGTILSDAVSMSHPYGAFALPIMMEHANIYHTEPKLVYIPYHAALDTFNKSFANELYLLEERPEGDWSNKNNLGGFSQFINTEKVKEKLRDDHQYKADQHLFIKARLFDILISDVDRHAGNWKWGVADTGIAIFKPIPIDRDQAFFTHNGLLSGFSLAVTRRRLIQSFGYDIKNIKTLTSYDRLLDHFFANEMEKEDWLQVAVSLQQSLTDSVIIKSVQQLPPEIFAVSGKEIIKKLKYRRDKLQHHAAQYYAALAKNVEINGSKKNEYFEVKKLDGNKIIINVYRMDSKEKKEATPYYQRIFNANETNTITIYGFGGDDIFDITKEEKEIKITIEKDINKTQFD